MSSVPKMIDVNELIVIQVAARWQDLAIVLGVKDFLMDAISVNHPNDCEGACRDMLRRWLREEQHTGEGCRSWSTLLAAISRAGFVELERNLQRQQFKAKYEIASL